MTWAGLSSKEWCRRPLRSGIAAAGVALGTAALFSLLCFEAGYRAGVRRELDGLGAHVLLVPKGCPYDAASMALHGASWPCYLKQEYLTDVRAIPGVAVAVPEFMTAIFDDHNGQVVYVGADEEILSLRPAWRVQGSFPAEPGRILAGAEVARREGWKVGQLVKLPGLADQSATVAGILQPTGGADDAFVYLPLGEAQRRFHHPQELTHILVRLKDPAQMEEVAGQLRGCDAGLSMNVVPLAQVLHTIDSLVSCTRFFLSCVALLAVLMAAAGVTNAVLIAVSERTAELALLRAMGASPAGVFALVWLESLQLCLVGAVSGIAVALLGSGAIESWVRARVPFAPAENLLQWHWWAVVASVWGALALGSMAAFLPAWHAARVSPMAVMRNSHACS